MNAEESACLDVSVLSY